MAIKGRLARDLKLLLDGDGTAAPRPKRVRRPAALAAPAVVLEFVLPYRATSEANARSWRQRSRRTQQARAAWLTVLHWAGAFQLVLPRLPQPLVVTLTRLGGRRMDRHDNERVALKGCVDSVAESLGLDDGDERVVWAYGAWEPGRECGVRVRLEAGGG